MAAAPEQQKMMIAGNDGTDVLIEELVPINACCCIISSCYCDFPKCLGCKADITCCCLHHQDSCCKCNSPSSFEQNPKKCVQCFKGEMNCIMPYTCCQGQQQICCLDCRVALPCTEEVPCMMTCLPFCVACTIYKLNIGCCKKVGELVPDVGKNNKVVDIAGDANVKKWGD